MIRLNRKLLQNSLDYSANWFIIVAMKRLQKTAILKDLEKKMVLIVGPRQSGKTWLAQDIGKSYQHSVYLNYDSIEDRKIIHEQTWLGSTELLILDELHKMPGWKNYLKGLYDTKPSSMKIIVTGSARLDIFNQIGDSLAGRYFMHRLLPLSPAELNKTGQEVDLDKLIQRSGYPEPYLAKNLIEAERWRMQYINSLLSTDIFEFDKVQNIKAMQLVFNLLRHRVGSPISYQSISEDVSVSSNTVKKYVQILEALYVIFTITPYSKNIARSLLKEPKIYFFDVGLVKEDDGAKFENLVAVSLLKHVYAKIDYEAENYSLHYLRTKDKQEIDFALVKDGNIEQMIEAKLSNKEPTKTLLDFHNKYNLSGIQVVKELRQESIKSEIKILKALEFLQELML